MKIESICAALRARRHTPPELRSKLFEGYAACDDAQFQEHIKRKQESYEHGTIAQFDDAQLIQLRSTDKIWSLLLAAKTSLGNSDIQDDTFFCARLA